MKTSKSIPCKFVSGVDKGKQGAHIGLHILDTIVCWSTKFCLQVDNSKTIIIGIKSLVASIQSH